MKKIKSKFKKTIFALSIFVALFFVVQILGKPLINAFLFKVNLEAPSIAYMGEKNSVIVDKVGTRCLVLDEKKNVKNIINITSASPIDEIYGVKIYGDYIYCYGAKYIKDTSYIKYNRVIRTKINDDKFEIIYESDISKQQVALCGLFDLDLYNGDIYVTECMYNSKNYFKNNICVSKIPSDKAKDMQYKKNIYEIEDSILKVQYVPESNNLYLLNVLGEVKKVENNNLVNLDFNNNHVVRNFVINNEALKDESFVWIDADTDSIRYNKEQMVEKANVYYYLSYCDNKIIYDDMDKNILNVYDIKNKESNIIESVDFSFVFGFEAIAESLSVIYFIVLIIIFIIRVFLDLYRKKNYEKLKRIFIAIAITFSAVFIAIFYNIKMLGLYEENIVEDIKLHSDYFAKTISLGDLENSLLRPEESVDDKKVEAWEKAYINFDKLYGNFKNTDNLYDREALVSIFYKVDNKYYTVYYSWKNEVVNDSYFEEDINLENVSVNKIITPWVVLYEKTSPIYNEENQLIGYIAYGRDATILQKNIVNKCIDSIFLLMTIFISIYIIVIEIIKLINGLKERRKMIESNALNPEVALERTAAFLLFMIYLLDGVVLVLVAKTLIEAGGYNDSMKMFLMSLPAFVMGIGCTFGSMIFTIIAGRIHVKKIIIIGCLIMFFGYIGAASTVLINNFPLFCLCLFISYTAVDVLLSLIVLMKVKPKEEERRYGANKAYSTGRLSGMIFGALLGGFVSQYIGNFSIYIIKAILSVMLFILLFMILPKDTIYMEKSINDNGDNKKSIKEYIKFFMEKPMFANMFFAIMPMWIVVGYKSYLFPIYSSALEFSVLYITDFFVFSRIILLFMSDFVDELMKKMDYWKRFIYSMLFIGVLCLGFVLNKTIVWAIVVLFSTGAVDMISIPSQGMIWPRQVKVRNVNEGNVSNIIYVWEELANGVRETVISGFMFFGAENASIVLGMFCIICMAIYVICTKKSALANPN